MPSDDYLSKCVLPVDSELMPQADAPKGLPSLIQPNNSHRRSALGFEQCKCN